MHLVFDRFLMVTGQNGYGIKMNQEPNFDCKYDGYLSIFVHGLCHSWWYLRKKLEQGANCTFSQATTWLNI